MANIYVRSTDGVNTDDGSTWVLAKLDLAGAAAIDAAGDTIFVSQAHAETTAAAITIALAGTVASPTRLICGNDAATPPSAVATTATVSTTGASAITITGSVFTAGIAFSAGSAASAASINLSNTNSPDTAQEYSACDFILGGANSAAAIVIGASGSSNAAKSKCLWKDVRVKFASVGHRIELYQEFVWRGGSFISGSAAITYLFRLGAQGRSSPALIEGVDLSELGAATNLINGTTSVGRVVFRNCKLPASWTGGLATGQPALGLRAEMHNCDSADTNYMLWIEDYAGSIKIETALVKTGGASNGAVPFSLKMAASPNASYPTVPLESCELPAIWNAVTGSPVTVTVDVLHDSATNLTDSDIWLEVQYLGTSGFPLSSFINDAKADVLATAADQTASSATWTTTGMSNPNTQKLAVTFTPQEAGYLQAKVILAKASTTVYVDPKLQVS